MIDGQPPPRVKNIEAYWRELPPEPSPRCLFWLARIDSGWRRNRRVRALGYHESAEFFGVYIAEYINMISPKLLAADEADQSAADRS